MDGADMEAGTTRTRHEVRLLSLEDVSQQLGVPRQTLYNWRTRGKGPKGFKLGRHIRYYAHEVDAWVQEQIDKEGNR